MFIYQPKQVIDSQVIFLFRLKHGSFQCFHFYQQNSGQWTSATQRVTYEKASLMPGTTAQSESSPISHSGFA